jgi:hypothetical protein
MFNGLIQHSFALRIPSELRPQYTRDDISDPRWLLDALLAAPARAGGDPGFHLMSVDGMSTEGQPSPGRHSLLVKRGLTNVSALPLAFVADNEVEYTYPMPRPFNWAAPGSPPKLGFSPELQDPVRAWEGCIPADKDALGRPRANDYLIVNDDSPDTCPPKADPVAVSWLLCQLLAHRRSRLFGWSLERRIFNVLLPHALLRPSSECGRGESCSSGAWIAQPALSLFLAAKDRGFRPIFSLTLFMIPVVLEEDGKSSSEDGKSSKEHGKSSSEDAPSAQCSHGAPTVDSRTMGKAEIYQTIQAGWSVATSRPRSTRPRFTVSGPLCDYVAALDPSLPARLDITPAQRTSHMSAAGGATWSLLTLRQTTETSLFAAALRMVVGPGASADRDTRERIGDRVLMALSASRASSVVVVDEKLNKQECAESRSEGRFPGSLGHLMQEIAGPIHIASGNDYRLDRSFFDEDDYAIGVLPANRCIVVTTDPCSQMGYQESGLLEAGWIAYMVIGAATATGMMRAIYHEIEQVDQSKPNAIAAIEREVVVDLHEIYDLDITWEQYRHRYGLLRDALGITRDYESLQCKLDALSRETRTRFEGTAQMRLMWLTAAIVLLTLVVVVVTMLHK